MMKVHEVSRWGGGAGDFKEKVSLISAEDTFSTASDRITGEAEVGWIFDV